MAETMLVYPQVQDKVEVTDKEAVYASPRLQNLLSEIAGESSGAAFRHGAGDPDRRRGGYDGGSRGVRGTDRCDD